MKIINGARHWGFERYHCGWALRGPFFCVSRNTIKGMWFLKFLPEWKSWSKIA